MATTERGIYYTTAADDTTVADFNVITKAQADSTEAALDALQAHSDARSAAPYAAGTYVGTYDIVAGTGAMVQWTSEDDPSGILSASSGQVHLTPGVWQVSASAALTGPSGSGFFRLQLLLGAETIAHANSGQWLSCAAAVRITSTPAPAVALLACNDNGSGQIRIGWARLSVARVGPA